MNTTKAVGSQVASSQRTGDSIVLAEIWRSSAASRIGLETRRALTRHVGALRADPATRDTPMIVVFEQRATIDIRRDKIADVLVDDDGAVICLDPSAIAALEALDQSERATWRLALADRIVDNWRYRPDDPDCPLYLRGVDTDTLAEARLADE